MLGREVVLSGPPLLRRSHSMSCMTQLQAKHSGTPFDQAEGAAGYTHFTPMPKLQCDAVVKRFLPVVSKQTRHGKKWCDNSAQLCLRHAITSEVLWHYLACVCKVVFSIALCVRFLTDVEVIKAGIERPTPSGSQNPTPLDVRFASCRVGFSTYRRSDEPLLSGCLQCCMGKLEPI